MCSDVAMTGEITLRGLVLPVGGIKEKTIAAARAGIRRVILPDRNRRDLEDIPPSARAMLEFVWVERAAQALDIALGETAPAAEAPAAADRHAGRAARSTARKEAPRQPGARLGSER